MSQRIQKRAFNSAWSTPKAGEIAVGRNCISKKGFELIQMVRLINNQVLTLDRQIFY